MDNVRIQDDLYEYVNGAWIENAVIPDDKPVTGGFMELDEGVEKKLMSDFNAFAKSEKTCDIESVQDAVKIYSKVLDEKTRNDLGIKPIMPLLNTIKNIKTVEELNNKAKELMLKGVDFPINFGVDADMKDATKNSFVVQGPSIILPDTAYYNTDQGNKLLEVYKNMALKALAFTDLNQEEIDLFTNDTLKFDELISKEVKSQLEWADYVKNYNPTSLQEVCDDVKPFDLKGLLNSIYGNKELNEVIVYDPKAIKNMKNYFNEETFTLYIHWAYVQTLLNNTSKLSEELSSIGTMYRRTLMGVESDPTVEKRAYKMASNSFAQPVGIYYGRTYFGEEAKKDIVSLVKKIIEAYKVRITNNTFLEEQTKQKAIKKLSTIAIKMGYPDDVDEIYKNIHVSNDDNLIEAFDKIREVKMLHSLNKLFKPVDKNEWMMPGHMVNACYDPNRNDITFPAAILQKPFYGIDQKVSENLGGIGAVIAHEISHAFDNNGAHFDENGNLFDWWTKKDLENFEKMTKEMIAQWDGIEYANDKVNGELVVSENIADNGGVAVTLQIMHELNDNDFESYFKNYARIWCQKSRDEYKLFLLKNDVHSPAKLRVNIQVRNFKEWYDTFDVKETDQMYIPEDKRIIIW